MIQMLLVLEAPLSGLTVQVLHFNPIANGSKVVAQMECASGLDP